MSKYNYSDFERQLNMVLAHHSAELSEIHFPSTESADACIASSEALLRKLGYKIEKPNLQGVSNNRRTVIVPKWESLCVEAERHVGTDCDLEALFTEDELRENSAAVRKLNAEYAALNRLDRMDVAISAFAALTSAAIDLLLVGIPKKGPEGLSAGTLSNYIRDYFEKKYPEDEMQRLANSKESKVPYDAQDNRNTTE